MGESVSSAAGPEGHPFQPHTPCPQVLEPLPSQNPIRASAPGLAGPHRFRGGLRGWLTFRFWSLPSSWFSPPRGPGVVAGCRSGARTGGSWPACSQAACVGRAGGPELSGGCRPHREAEHETLPLLLEGLLSSCPAPRSPSKPALQPPPLACVLCFGWKQLFRHHKRSLEGAPGADFNIYRKSLNSKTPTSEKWPLWSLGFANRSQDT